MITKFEYIVEPIFGEKEFYLIEYIDDNYYYTSNLINKLKIQKEETENIIQKILGNITLKKEKDSSITFDAPKSYVKVQNSYAETEFYSTETYDFDIASIFLKDFNLKVMKLEL